MKGHPATSNKILLQRITIHDLILSTEGVRASIYNGSQFEGIKKLRDFMEEFAEKNEVRNVNSLSRLWPLLVLLLLHFDNLKNYVL